MIIKPVLPFNSKYFIWELSDIALPDSTLNVLEEYETVDYNDKYNQGFLTQPDARKKLKHVTDGSFDSIYNEVFKYILNQTDYDISNIWPDYWVNLVKDKNFTEFGVEIILDKPNFYMTPHLDNNVIFATLLINLKDNVGSHTKYFEDYNVNKTLYKGPYKKGTGVLHINSPYLLHS